MCCIIEIKNQYSSGRQIIWKKHLQKTFTKNSEKVISIVNLYLDDWLNENIKHEILDVSRILWSECEGEIEIDEDDPEKKFYEYKVDPDLITILNLYDKNPLNILFIKDQIDLE